VLLLVYAMAGGLHEACADWRSLRDYMTRDAESQKSGVKGETGARRERGVGCWWREKSKSLAALPLLRQGKRDDKPREGVIFARRRVSNGSGYCE
jgi:hypothetical protein